MKAFAELLDRLTYTPSRNAKLRLMQDYFRATPDPDRGWALTALTDGLPFSFPLRRTLADMMARRMDPDLFRMSRDYVGDTAETIALVWGERGHSSLSLPLAGRGRGVGGEQPTLELPQPPLTLALSPQAGRGTVASGESGPPRLSDIVSELALIGRNDLGPRLETWLDALDATGRWALLKLLTGAMRVGVSARLAKTAVADMAGFKVDDVEEVWHGLAPPYEPLFAWLEGRAPKPDVSNAPVFRPLMLSHALEDKDWAALDLNEFSAEWKWDGIRVQIVAAGGEARALLAHGRRHRPELSRCRRRHAFQRGARRRAAGGAQRRGRALQRPAAAPQPQGRDAEAARAVSGARAALRCAHHRGRGPARAAVHGAARAAGGVVRQDASAAHRPVAAHRGCAARTSCSGSGRRRARPASKASC